MSNVINFPNSLESSDIKLVKESLNKDFSFSNFLALQESDLNEAGAWQSLKQGFSGALQSWDGKKDAASEETYAKYKEKAFSAINKAREAYGQFKSKTGLSMPLAIALVAGGIAGGPTAIPMAAIMYFTRRALMNPVLALAGHGFDKGVEALKKVDKKITEKPEDKPEEKGPVKESFILENWTFALDYDNFMVYKTLKEENLITCTFQEWIANPDLELLVSEGARLDWLMRKLGAGAGHVMGMLKSGAKKAYNAIFKGLPSLVSWAMQNKVAIAKAVFLMALGLLMGQGITRLSNAVFTQAYDVLQTVGQNSGQIPEADIQSVAKTAGMSFDSDTGVYKGDAGEPLYVTGDTVVKGGGMAMDADGNILDKAGNPLTTDTVLRTAAMKDQLAGLLTAAKEKGMGAYKAVMDKLGELDAAAQARLAAEVPPPVEVPAQQYYQEPVQPRFPRLYNLTHPFRRIGPIFRR